MGSPGESNMATWEYVDYARMQADRIKRYWAKRGYDGLDIRVDPRNGHVTSNMVAGYPPPATLELEAA